MTVLKLINLIRNSITARFEQFFMFGCNDLCALNVACSNQQNKSKISINDIWKDGFLWAVPKHRRPLEKRLNRKFGWPKYNWKPLVPKEDLVLCRACGNFHEVETICGVCFKKWKETVAVDGKTEHPIENITEPPKKQIIWFGHNLIEPSSQKTSDEQIIDIDEYQLKK